MPLHLNPRRPLDGNNIEGYLESDKDYVLNNILLCVKLLDNFDYICCLVEDDQTKAILAASKTMMGA